MFPPQETSPTYECYSCVETASNTTALPWLVLEGDLDPVDRQEAAGGAGAATAVVIDLLEGLGDERASLTLHLSRDTHNTFSFSFSVRLFVALSKGIDAENVCTVSFVLPSFPDEKTSYFSLPCIIIF